MSYFVSTYDLLSQAERAFVDGYVDILDREASRSQERLVDVLHARPVNEVDIARSRGLLARADVKAAILQRVEQLTHDREITPNKVLNELTNIAFTTLQNFMSVGEDGRPYWDFLKPKPEHWAAVKSIKWDDSKDPLHPKVEIVFHDKIAALQQLMKYLGLTDEDNPHWAAERVRRLGPAPVIDMRASEQEAAGQYSRLLEMVA